MVSKNALAILRRMEIAVNANSESVAKVLEKDFHEELGLAGMLGEAEQKIRGARYCTVTRVRD